MQKQWAWEEVSLFIRFHTLLTGAQQKINFKTDHNSSTRYATTLLLRVTVWSVRWSTTEYSWRCIALMPTVIILNISMTECSALVQNIHSRSKHRVSKLQSQLHQKELSDTAGRSEVACYILSFYVLILYLHFNLNNTEHQLPVVWGEDSCLWLIHVEYAAFVFIILQLPSDGYST